MATEDELFDLFGRVSFTAQMFESALGTLCITMRTIVGDPFKCEADAQAYLDQVDTLTLGNLLSRVRKMAVTIDLSIMHYSRGSMLGTA